MLPYVQLHMPNAYIVAAFRKLGAQTLLLHNLKKYIYENLCLLPALSRSFSAIHDQPQLQPLESRNARSQFIATNNENNNKSSTKYLRNAKRNYTFFTYDNGLCCRYSAAKVLYVAEPGQVVVLHLYFDIFWSSKLVPKPNVSATDTRTLTHTKRKFADSTRHGREKLSSIKFTCYLSSCTTIMECWFYLLRWWFVCITLMWLCDGFRPNGKQLILPSKYGR